MSAGRRIVGPWPSALLFAGAVALYVGERLLAGIRDLVVVP